MLSMHPLVTSQPERRVQLHYILSMLLSRFNVTCMSPIFLRPASPFMQVEYAVGLVKGTLVPLDALQSLRDQQLINQVCLIDCPNHRAADCMRHLLPMLTVCASTVTAHWTSHTAVTTYKVFLPWQQDGHAHCYPW